MPRITIPQYRTAIIARYRDLHDSLRQSAIDGSFNTLDVRIREMRQLESIAKIYDVDLREYVEIGAE